MADTKISALTAGTAAATDRIPTAISPFASGDNRYLTLSAITTYVLGHADTLTSSGTMTLTSGGNIVLDGTISISGRVSTGRGICFYRNDPTGVIDVTTIASGVATVSFGASYMRIDTESAAASDDLDTLSISIAANGFIVVIQAANSARTVVAKDGTGNMKLNGDCTLDNLEDTLTLIYNGNESTWYEVCRSNNGA